ncbi:MAG TPA: hypothetical protein VF432_24460 [Thermoanaerobaculia bacterium]
MSRLPHLLLVLLSVTAASAAGTLQDTKIPRFAQSAGGDGFPLWVSASLAIADGRIQPDFFEPAFLAQLERNEAKNADRCTAYISLGPLHVPEGAPIEDRVGVSYSVVTGSITGAEQGFFRGTPGTAYALKVSGRPKMLGHAATADVVYIFVATADIPTARGRVCSTPLPGTPLPEIGDRVVAFAPMPAQDEERQFILVNGQSHLILERRGALIGRTEAKTTKVRNLADVLNAIQESDGLRTTPVRREE